MAGHANTRSQFTGIPGDVQERITKELLIGSVITDLETTDSGVCLEQITVLTKDGRTVSLNEENFPSWEGSSEGWISIKIDGKMYPETVKKYE